MIYVTLVYTICVYMQLGSFPNYTLHHQIYICGLFHTPQFAVNHFRDQISSPLNNQNDHSHQAYHWKVSAQNVTPIFNMSPRKNICSLCILALCNIFQEHNYCVHQIILVLLQSNDKTLVVSNRKVSQSRKLQLS